MKFARRHRRKILVLISLFAIGAMTFGFLRRIGIDPLGSDEARDERAADEGR